MNENEANYLSGFVAGLDHWATHTEDYKNGIIRGKHEERQYILHFVEEHEGIPITVEDIVNEIESRYRVEMNEHLKGLK